MDRTTEAEEVEAQGHDGLVAALEESAHELDRMIAALALAERELEAAEAALRRTDAADLREAVEAVLGHLDRPALLVGPAGDLLWEAPGSRSLAEEIDLADAATRAQAASPDAATVAHAQAIAVGEGASLIVVVAARDA